MVELGNIFHPRLGAGARIWRYFWYINIVDIFLISYTDSDTFQVVGLGNSFHPRLGAIQEGIRPRIYLYLVFPVDRSLAVESSTSKKGQEHCEKIYYFLPSPNC